MNTYPYERGVHYETAKLSAGGLIRARKRGNLRLIRAVTDSLLSRPLTDLLAVTYGPLPVLTDLITASSFSTA